MRKEKAPIYKSSRRKAPKTQQICHYEHVRKTRGLFLLHDKGVGFSSHNNFANLGSFAKVSVPVRSIIPRFDSANIGANWAANIQVYTYTNSESFKTEYKIHCTNLHRNRECENNPVIH